MIALLTLVGIAAFAVAYSTYARFLERLFQLSPQRETPAHTCQDGRDYFPAKTPILLGHHFSSIAGAGPIVGPVFGALVFGWAPVMLWVVLGSIFIGGVHDFGSLAVSIRHRARSIAEVAREYMNQTAVKLLLIFIWLTLVYVLVVFLDLTATTFAPPVPAGLDAERAAVVMRRGGGVATSSLMFIGLALLLGVAVYRLKASLLPVSLVFVPLMFLAIYAGQQMPFYPSWLPALHGSPAKTWSLILLVYCLIASVTPVWILLQPRDYLSSFLLYACLLGGLVGIVISPVFGGADLALTYPAFLGFKTEKLGFLFPALFITVACGACSGFHSIVASGTTAKQLDREPNARVVGYGAMLLEGVLALISVATVAILAQGSPETRLSPTALFASGLGRFLELIGIPRQLGEGFGLLAISTFLLTTLDTGTRLGRYVLEELLQLKGRLAVWIATTATLALPLAFNLMTFHDDAGRVIPVWKIIWPVFGSTNQLLGGLALMVISVWLHRTGRPAWVTLIPMAFMVCATTLSLAQLAWHHGVSLVGIIAGVLLLLAVVLLVEAGRALRGPVEAH
jgi:carbon starvation protein